MSASDPLLTYSDGLEQAPMVWNGDLIIIIIIIINFYRSNQKFLGGRCPSLALAPAEFQILYVGIGIVYQRNSQNSHRDD